VNLTQDGAVSAIRREKLATAGTAKAAWLQAGDSIGAKTRVPAWLRKAKSLGRSSILRRGWSTVITLINAVRYVSNVLPMGKLRAALKSTESNQIKRIQAVLAKRSRDV
jgi:hypothetical protein